MKKLKFLLKFHYQKFLEKLGFLSSHEKRVVQDVLNSLKTR